jgi:signal transduction histidine kinase
MARFLDRLFIENHLQNEDILVEFGNLKKIREQIINSIYFFSAIIGTFAIYGTFVRIIRFGWQPFFIFNFFLYVIVWLIYFLRNKLSLNWKASIFFIIFFVLASFINYTNGIISGPLTFVFITTLVTLIYGWKIGVASVILTTIVRTIIGWCYYKGILHYSIDLVTYANSLAAMITGIMTGLVIASITVFAINKFYKWLIIALKTVSVKAKEQEQMNKELLIAKQKAEEHDRLKSVFLANMSHEIRTPMNAILGFSELLAKPNLSDEQKTRFLAVVQERSMDLMRIVEDILDISKIEVGQMDILDSEFEFYPMLQDLFEYFKLKMEQVKINSKIEFTLNIPENIKRLTLCLDRHRLRQILNNLLDNAFKFTSEGEIELGCKLDTDLNLLCWVKDTGIGIPEEKQTVIFDRFRQVEDNFASRQYGGTGLGLSIVQGIIKLMNGKIWLESEVGKGTTFYFSLPPRNPVKLNVPLEED